MAHVSVTGPASVEPEAVVLLTVPLLELLAEEEEVEPDAGGGGTGTVQAPTSSANIAASATINHKRFLFM